MKHFPFIALLLVSAPPVANAVEVILEFEAKAQTIVGTPFGLTVPRFTKVTGHFMYETSGATDSNGSPERGWYQLTEGGGFSATFKDNTGTSHTLTGSTTPWLEVEDIPDFMDPNKSIDTFRFLDGDDSDTKGGLMKFDGVEDGDYLLFFAMTDGSGEAFDDDSLPECYPMTGVEGPPDSPFPSYPYPHTLYIGDGSGFVGTGRMLLQLNWLDPTPVITTAGFSGGFFSITFTSQLVCTYTIEFSTDLVNWTPVATNFPSSGTSTNFTDTDVITRLGALPDDAYYRVRKE